MNDMKKYMWRAVGILLLTSHLSPLASQAQTYENQFRRPVSDVMKDVAARFDVRFKFDGNVDTAGVMLTYADFRIRPYSLEQTLDNICKHFDWNWWKQSGNLYKIKRYEYPRRHEDEGRQMLNYLSSLYHNKVEWEARRDSLRKEVRQRLELDAFLDSCVLGPAQLSKIRKHDGYTTQNICIELTPGQHLFGTIYAPIKTKSRKRKVSPLTSDLSPLIVCPDGHWPMRYRKDEQQRLGTLARMGAVCVDFDLYGWGESEKEVGAEAHHTSRAHVYQAACGYVLLDWMLTHRKDIDTKRVGVMGGSGGGTHTVLLSLLDDRVTASAPVVHLASHFDGGCPCESGKPVQLSAEEPVNPNWLPSWLPNPCSSSLTEATGRVVFLLWNSHTCNVSMTSMGQRIRCVTSIFPRSVMTSERTNGRRSTTSSSMSSVSTVRCLTRVR